MKVLNFLICTGLLCVTLSGCGIGGHWMNGNPNIGPSYPYGAHWIKEGMTRETHLSDWIQCGGSADLNDGVEAKSGMTNKEFYDGLRAARTHIRSCMGSRGYVWIETCDQRCL